MQHSWFSSDTECSSDYLSHSAVKLHNPPPHHAQLTSVLPLPGLIVLQLQFSSPPPPLVSWAKSQPCYKGSPHLPASLQHLPALRHNQTMFNLFPTTLQPKDVVQFWEGIHERPPRTTAAETLIVQCVRTQWTPPTLGPIFTEHISHVGDMPRDFGVHAHHGSIHFYGTTILHRTTRDHHEYGHPKEINVAASHQCQKKRSQTEVVFRKAVCHWTEL